ncbi:MAG: hypothetical protein QMB03_11395, partial [Spirosomataceae bacterium]
MKHSIVLFLCFAALFACRKVDINKDRTERFPKPIDTQTLPVTMQERKVWQATENVAFSNTFDGARLNGVTVLNDSTFQLTISPENFPINPSPWYSFKVWEKTPKRIFLNFVYENGKHRYAPKSSTDGKNWRIAE